MTAENMIVEMSASAIVLLGLAYQMLIHYKRKVVE